MNDTLMTLVGNVVDTPNLRRTKSGHLVANFRVASTPRRFDREQNAWVDGNTLFVTVTCWRAMGENVAESLRKGQPVVVLGRYGQREYEREETLRTTYELEAVAIGHDLSRGTSTFERMMRPALSTPVELDEEGRPADETAHYLDLDGDESVVDDTVAQYRDVPPGSVVDTDTGEVRTLAGSAPGAA
jgi:single-strand DNA-binding protein